MTPPRRVLAGRSYLVTRRCSERRFFLRPSKLTNQIFLYVLALAARRYGVAVHALCVLSNHVHLVVTDTAGQLPAFMQYLDSLVARAVNASLGRFEGFWATDGSYSAVEPLDPRDVIAKTAYVLANPVAAGLVATASEWPGLWTAPQLIGGRLTASRPDVFFDPKGHLPQTVELDLSAPPTFASAEAFRALLVPALERLEQEHRSAFGRGRRRFLGVKRVLAQHPLTSPAAGEQRFHLSPRIAARDASTRIAGLTGLQAFHRQYRDAWARRAAGALNVIFPAGTYLLRLQHGVCCAGATG